MAKKAGVHHETVAAVRAEAEANGEIRHYTERIEESGRKARGRKPKHKEVSAEGGPLERPAQEVASEGGV